MQEQNFVFARATRNPKSLLNIPTNITHDQSLFQRCNTAYYELSLILIFLNIETFLEFFQT